MLLNNLGLLFLKEKCHKFGWQRQNLLDYGGNSRGIEKPQEADQNDRPEQKMGLGEAYEYFYYLMGKNVYPEQNCYVASSKPFQNWSRWVS